MERGWTPNLADRDANALVSDIVVESICFEATAAATNNNIRCAAVSGKLHAGTGGTLCALRRGSRDANAALLRVGINLSGVTDVELIANRLDNFLVGILSSDYQGGLRIADNAIDGITGLFLNQPGSSLGQYGIRIDTDHTQPCRIENNRIRHFWVGISLRHQAVGSLVADNRISRSAGITQRYVSR